MNTLNGYSKSTLTDKYVLTAAGGHRYIYDSEFIIGTQTAATGSWTGVSIDSELYDGKQISYWLPFNGSGNATLNLTLAGGTTTGAVNCYYGGTSRLTTHYGAGNIIRLVYRKNVNIGGTTYTGWWADANYVDGNTYTSAWCGTSAGTAAKTASCSNFTLKANSYLHVLVRYSNTAASALTLNVNSQGAKPIYINGKASSSSNYTLPAGTYLVFYDGTNFYFRTDKVLPGTIETATQATKAEITRYIECADTRSTTIDPTALDAAKGVAFDFKQKSVTGLAAPYSGIMTFRPYSNSTDWSGGPVHQLAFDVNGLHHRTASSATWGSWSDIITTTYYSDKLSGYITSSTASLSSYWGKLWDVTRTSLQDDLDMTFYIHSSYNNERGFIHLRARRDSSTTDGVTTYSFGCWIKQITGNLTKSRFRLYHNASSGKLQLWCNVNARWGVYNCKIISSTSRTGKEQLPITGTLYANSFTTAQTLPTDSYEELTNVREPDYVLVSQHNTNDTEYPLVWSNETNTSNKTSNQLYKSYSNLTYNPGLQRISVQKVHSTGQLLLSAATEVALRYGNTDATSVVLANEEFRPYSVANSKINLGNSSIRWKGLYAQTGNFSGDVLVSGALKIGSNSTRNYIAFRGTTADGDGAFNHTYIGENIYNGTESSELVLFKGNDSAPNVANPNRTGPDRIRYIAAGHLFQIYKSPVSGTFESVCTSTTPINTLAINAFDVTSYLNVLPSANNTLNLGSSSFKWANIYATTFIGSLSGNASTATNSDKLDGFHETDFFRYRGEIDTAYVDIDVYTSGDSRFKKINPGTYSIPRSGYSEMLISFAKNTGSTSSLELKTSWEHNTKLFVRKTIDANRISGAWKALAYYDDIVEALNQYYWANIKIKSSQDSRTQPTFYHTRIEGPNPALYIRSTDTSDNSYSIIRFGNSDEDNKAHIFLNGPNRTTDGGKNTMTIRNNVGDIRLDSYVIVTKGQNLYGLTSTCNKANDASYTMAAMQIREYNFGGSQTDSWGIAPRLSWHWSGRVQTQIGLSSGGDLYLSKDQFANYYLLLHTGNSSITDYNVKIGGTTKNFVRDWGSGAADMNAVARGGRSSMGMANLIIPEGTATAVNPNGQTGWHHFINMSFDDGGGGSNAWITQIANKAGSTDLWVRSRYGGTIDNTVAWVAGWTRILTGSNYTNVLDGNYVKAYKTLTNTYNIDDDWGQSVVTFDPKAKGTYPSSGNLANFTLLNLGNNFSRRKQFGFDWYTDSIFYRRHVDSWTSWVTLLHSGNYSNFLDSRYCTETEVNNKLAGYLPLAGGTMSSGTAQIQRAGSSTSWHQGRTNAMIRINSYSGYNAIASMKTTNGDWSLGVHSNNVLYFTYITDTNFNAGTNTTTAQVYINAAGNVYATHFYEHSDINLKTNIKPIVTSDNIPQLKSFDWKSDGSHSYGLIAQELEEQGYSELVSDEGGQKTVKYSAALSLIVGKLQVKIKELEKEIENLKNKN